MVPSGVSNRQRERIDDRMGDVEELHLETAELNFVLSLDDVDRRVFEQTVLRQFVLHQAHREAAAVERNVQVGKHERQGADVVFVAVRQDDRFDFGAVFEQERDVGDDDIDAEQFLVGKHDARIDDDDRAVAAERHHVHSEFAEAAERNNIQCFVGLH